MGDVLDAFALLALLRAEPGWEVAATSTEGGARVCTANLCESMAVLARNGVPAPEAAQLIAELPIEQVSLDFDLAMSAGALIVHAMANGLSMGDRICLALGARDGATVVTADRAWASVAAAVGVTVKLIRAPKPVP